MSSYVATVAAMAVAAAQRLREQTGDGSHPAACNNMRIIASLSWAIDLIEHFLGQINDFAFLRNGWEKLS